MTDSSIDAAFSALSPEQYPQHIAIIPNGHRTWAKKHGKSSTDAHRIGMELLIEFSRFLREIGVHTVTVWAMSTENYKKRAKEEVEGLMDLLVYALNHWAGEFYEEGARIVHLGRKDHLPEQLRTMLSQWEEKSKENTKHCANIAFDYGGHDEILRAIERVVADVQSGALASVQDLWKEDGSYHDKYPYYAFKNYLDTADQPYPFPDLIIRSSGELRLSGFMPWQSVYSEFYSTPLLMPEFTLSTLKAAIVDYAHRKRTFGGNNGSASPAVA